MKKRIFFMPLLLIICIAVNLFVSCSPSSGSTDNGGLYGSGGSINANDGDAIAYFLCEDLCGRKNETVKLCFYNNGIVKLRATSLEDETYGRRYDKLRGTYTGDPTVDGTLVVEITEEGEWVPDVNEDDYTSFEDFYKDMASGKIQYKVEYEEYESGHWEGEIADDILRFSTGEYRFKQAFSSSFDDEYNFIKTTASDLGPYQYNSVDRRDNETKRTSWTVPEGYTSVRGFSEGSSEEGYTQYWEKITLPSTIKKISRGAFYNCCALKEINIPEGCKEIKTEAFYNCTSLEEITLPEGLEEIGDGAFYNCINLKKITIPSTIKKICPYAFAKKSSSSSSDEELEKNLELIFADGTKKIPDSAFKNSYTSSSYARTSMIKSITIPSSVKVIGEDAFANYGETIKYDGTLFELAPMLKDMSLGTNSNRKILCGETDVADFFKTTLDSELRNKQWENESDGILLTLKSDRTYTKKTVGETVNGLWFTNKDTTPYTITFYQEEKDPEEYEYSKGDLFYGFLDFTELGRFKKVNRYSVIEKKETTTEKWCDEAVKEDGKYIYYQYYLEKAVDDSSYFDCLDTPVYYEYSDSKYERKYYKPCKDKIETLLGGSSRKYTDGYDTFVYLVSDPQQ